MLAPSSKHPSTKYSFTELLLLLPPSFLCLFLLLSDLFVSFCLHISLYFVFSPLRFLLITSTPLFSLSSLSFLSYIWTHLVPFLLFAPPAFLLFSFLTSLSSLSSPSLHTLSVLHLLFLSFSWNVFFFSTYFSVHCCLQEVPCQWELLSVPGPGPVGPLWPVNSCLGEG